MLVERRNGRLHTASRNRTWGRDHSLRSSSFHLITLLAIAACAPGTRELPVTVAPLAVAPAQEGTRVFVAVHLANQQLDGGHYGGSAQVRQPFEWGIPDEQRVALIGNLPVVIAQTIRAELESSGFVPVDGGSEDVAHVELYVDSVEMNTYDPGLQGFGATLDGFGSAGNYWEASVHVTKITLARGGQDVASSPAKAFYAKTEPCPAQLDLDTMGLAQMFVTAATGGVPFAEGAEYRIDLSAPNPVVMASRHVGTAIAELVNQSVPAEAPRAQPAEG